MATDLSRDELRRLARMGAERRLEELRREEASIRAAFPDLGLPRAGKRAQGRKGSRAATSAAASANTAKTDREASQGAAKRRPRYKMSAAQKRAVSERMKKYWAARRKAKG